MTATKLEDESCPSENQSAVGSFAFTVFTGDKRNVGNVNSKSGPIASLPSIWKNKSLRMHVHMRIFG